MKYNIFEANISTLSGKIQKINAKLARIGLPLVTLSRTGNVTDERQVDGQLIRFVEMEIEVPTAAQNGWTFVATIVHTVEGNVIRSVPGYTVSDDYRMRPTWCDHCRTNRLRKDTYVIQHTDGRTMQVGSSCLQEFFGGVAKTAEAAANLLFNAHEIAESATKRDWLGGSALTIYRVDTDEYLKHVAAVVLKTGCYITKKAAYTNAQTGNRNTVATASIAAQSMEHAHDVDPQYPITAEAEKLAAESREWVRQTYGGSSNADDNVGDDYDAIKDSILGLITPSRDLSEFEHNLLVCARSEAIEPRLFGIAAYIVEAYRKHLQAEAAKRPQLQIKLEGLSQIFKMFAHATETGKLKRPAIRLANEDGQHLHLSLAGAASRNAGYVYVKADSGYEATYFGKISPEGRFQRAGGCTDAVEKLLQDFAANPEELATKYGRLTGCCAFCSRKLTDARSTQVGFGPVCAEKFGLGEAWKSALKQEEAAISEAEAVAANLEPVAA